MQPSVRCMTEMNDRGDPADGEAPGVRVDWDGRSPA